MSNFKGISGTPWHIEVLHREEDDARRHRARCKYYHQKLDGFCDYHKARCFGAAHCDYYKELVKGEERATLVTEKAKEFSGLKYVKTNIVLGKERFKNNPPTAALVEEAEQYYLEHRELDKPIVVKCINGRYVVADNSLRFYVAKKYHIQDIPIEMGTTSEIEMWSKLRERGTLVWNQKKRSVGTVIDYSLRFVTIRYDNEEVHKYDIYKCLKVKEISIL